MSKECPSCRNKNKDDAVMCTQCGFVFEQVGDKVTVESSPVIVDGAGTNTAIPNKCTVCQGDLFNGNMFWIEGEGYICDTCYSQKFMSPPMPEPIYQSRTPYKCPICEGRGHVPGGWYQSTGNSWVSSGTAFDLCKTCNGEGIVWG